MDERRGFGQRVIDVQASVGHILKRLCEEITEGWRYGDLSDAEKARLDEWITDMAVAMRQGPLDQSRAELVAATLRLREGR